MASANAIAAVGRAILSMLAAAVPKPEFAGATFELYQSKHLQAPMEEGIGLYLYRITPAARCGTCRRAPDRRTALPPLDAIDLHYLLISYARDAFKQQRLLGWAIRTIEDTPLFHASLLNQYGPETDTFHENEFADGCSRPSPFRT